MQNYRLPNLKIHIITGVCKLLPCVFIYVRMHDSKICYSKLVLVYCGNVNLSLREFMWCNRQIKHGQNNTVQYRLTNS